MCYLIIRKTLLIKKSYYIKSLSKNVILERQSSLSGADNSFNHVSRILTVRFCSSQPTYYGFTLEALKHI